MANSRPESRLDEVYFLKTDHAASLSSASPLERQEAFDHLPHSLTETEIGYIANHVARTRYLSGERRVRAYQRRAIKSIGDLALSRKLEEATGADIMDIATATSAANWLAQGSRLSRFYARQLRSRVETEIIDFSEKLGRGPSGLEQ